MTAKLFELRAITKKRRKRSFWVPRALRTTYTLDNLSDPLIIVLAQHHIDSSSILRQILDMFRSRQRNEIFTGYQLPVLSEAIA